MPSKIKKTNVDSLKKIVKKGVTKKIVVKKVPSVLMPAAKVPMKETWGDAVLKPAAVVKPLFKTKASSTTFWEFSVWFSGVLIMVMLVGTAYVVTKSGNEQKNLNFITSNSTAAEVTFSSLTGERVSKEILERRPLAVMVENLSSVRPQYGLSFADVVWEAPTEGGITRFLAIFQKGLPSKVGPVRSARPYFIDWASEVGALYTHSGGSPEALDKLAKGVSGLQDVNEFANGAAFTRDNTIDAPHNLFTAAETFYKYISEKGWKANAGEITPWVYLSNVDMALATSEEVAREILVPYYPFEYDALWRYSAVDNLYTRFMDGKEHKDKVTGENIQFRNLVVMFTDVVPVPKDPLLKVNIRTTGEGIAYVFTQGKVYEGKWQKSSPTARTIFVDGAGSYLPLTEGNTWISVMDKTQESELEYK